MDKVWFALRQTHYSAPDIKTLGTADETGPVLLGHLIPSLKKLDFAVNRGSILPFPPSMQVYPTTAIDVSWSNTTSSEKGFDTTMTAPIPAGISVGGTAALAFHRSVENSWAFGQLDTYIVQPTESYVRDLLETDVVKSWLAQQQLGLWSVYMITGIMIARAASFERSEDGGWSISGGPKFHIDLERAVYAKLLERSYRSLPAVAELDLQAKYAKDKGLKTGGKLTDFVWSIRLAKISRHLHDIVLQRDWSIKAFTDGATHSAAESEVDVPEVLTQEIGEPFDGVVIEDEAQDLAFVV